MIDITQLENRISRVRQESEKGLSEAMIRYISKDKKEPDWMLKHRLQSYEIF